MSLTLNDPACTTAPETRPAPSPRSPNLTPTQMVVVVAALTATPIIPSKLQLIDVVAVAALPLMLGYIRRSPRVRFIAITLIVWALAQLASDEYNGLGPRLSMQFVTAVTTLGLVPLLMWLGRGDFKMMRCALMGLTCGLAINWIFVEGNSIAAWSNWKYGLNVPISLALMCMADIAWRNGRRLVSLAALAAVCVLSMVTDHRHLAGVAVLTAILLAFPRTRHGHPAVTGVATGVILLLGALSGAFIQTAQAGLLGERSWTQVEGYGAHPLSIMVNVRPEPFQELYLFSRRPLLGYGSQPALDSEDYDGALAFLQSIGVVRGDVRERWRELEVPGVAAHSQAVDSWARAGAGSVPFWLAVVAVALWAGTSAIRFKSSPLVIMWTMLILWNTFFEPMTGLYHLEVAAYLALALTTIQLPEARRTPEPEAAP